MDKTHLELFPEEYDYVYDSVVEAKERAKGVNPMSQAYIDEVNDRRVSMGVKPYFITDNSPINHRNASTSPLYIDSETYVKNLKNE